MTIPRSKNGGVHTANFRVLRLASCPAVLVECGYLSNRTDGSQTRDSEYRELLADRIAEAIVEQRFGSGVYRASVRWQRNRSQNLPAAAPVSRRPPDMIFPAGLPRRKARLARGSISISARQRSACPTTCDPTIARKH